MIRRNADYTPGTPYWGRQGAGILFFSGDKVFLTLRSEEVNEPGTWGIPGGAVSGENVYDGALRETREELGWIPPHLVFDEVLFEDGGFLYTTFLARMEPEVAEGWRPRLNWENDEAEWFDVSELPDDLHFGLEHVIREREGLFGRRMARNMDERLRRLERAAQGGDPAARRTFLREQFRAGAGPGPQLAQTLERLVESANESADEGSGVTLSDVAQIVRAVLVPAGERRELFRHDDRWQSWSRPTVPLKWPGTAFAWVVGRRERELGDHEVASRRVVHALVVLRPDGNVTIGVAPTSEVDRDGDERDFRHYRPSLDPLDAWPDALSAGYTGVGFLDSPVVLHEDDDGYVGGEGPRPFPGGSWFSYQSHELEGGLYRWADVTVMRDRVTVSRDEAEAFAEGVGAPDPFWW